MMPIVMLKYPLTFGKGFGGSICLSKITIYPSVYLHTYPSRGHQIYTCKLLCVLLITSGWSFPKNKLKHGLILPQKMFLLSFCPSDVSLGPENSVTFYQKNDVWLPRCIIVSSCISGCNDELCLFGFPKYSQAHVAIFIRVVWQFLMQCRLWA